MFNARALTPRGSSASKKARRRNPSTGNALSGDTTSGSHQPERRIQTNHITPETVLRQRVVLLHAVEGHRRCSCLCYCRRYALAGVEWTSSALARGWRSSVLGRTMGWCALANASCVPRVREVDCPGKRSVLVVVPGGRGHLRDGDRGLKSERAAREEGVWWSGIPKCRVRRVALLQDGC